jgi:hypothetical protein
MLIEWFLAHRIQIILQPVLLILHPFSRSILQCLRPMRLLHSLTPCKIGNRTAQLQHAMIGPRTRPHALDCHTDLGRTIFVQPAKDLHLGWPHISIHKYIWLVHRRKAPILDGTRRLNALANGMRGFAAIERGQLLHRHAWYIQMNVDAVKNGPLMRFWYFWIIAIVQVHCFSESW